MLKQRSSDCSWLARAMYKYVTEVHFASLRTCTQWLTVLLSPPLSLYIFLTTCEHCYWFLMCHRKFSNSLWFKTYHHTMPFWLSTVHLQENVLFCCAAVVSRTYKINYRKNCAGISCWFWFRLQYRKCCKTSWATLVLERCKHSICPWKSQ